MFVRLDQQRREYILAVGIDGDVRMVEKGLLLKRNSEVIRRSLGDPKKAVMLRISACG